MPTYTDQLGITITLAAPPRRIVSLVPSQTELLHDLGLDAEVVGITKFCVHPAHWFRTKTRIGGTKAVHLDRVRALQPDLILANKEENVKEQIEALRALAPVWTSDVNTLDSAFEMISAISALTGKSEKGAALLRSIHKAFSGLQALALRRSVAYLIWKDPYMTVGGDTFISDILERCGFGNCFAALHRYPELNIEQLRSAPADIVFLSSEPYPFREKHRAELEALLPGKKVMLVDGEMFSWYGSRLQYTPGYIRDLQGAIAER